MGGKAYNRDISRRKALRKRRIARQLYFTRYGEDKDYYDNLHQFSKNKIHCSCPACSAKTRNKSKGYRNRKGFAAAINYKHSDKKKIEKLNYTDEENSSV